MQTFKCNICDRPMPPRVFEAHMKKRHAGMQSQNTDANLGQVPKSATELKIISEDHISLDPKIEVEQVTKDPHKKEFDWGKVYSCASCGAEYPAKAMDFHSKVVHGV